MSTYKWGRARVDVQHWVYRYYDASGAVLYVGFTNNLQHRDAAHRSHSRNGWRKLAVRIEVDEYPDRDSAFAAEGVEISKHVPFYNLNTNNKRNQVHREVLKAAEDRREAAFVVEQVALRARLAHLRAS